MKTTNKTQYTAPSINIVRLQHQSPLLVGTNPDVKRYSPDDPNIEDDLGW